MNETATPRTDEQLLMWNLGRKGMLDALGKHSLGHNGEDINRRVVLADFARQLERELAELQAKLAETYRNVENLTLLFQMENDTLRTQLARAQVEAQQYKKWHAELVEGIEKIYSARFPAVNSAKGDK